MCTSAASRSLLQAGDLDEFAQCQAQLIPLIHTCIYIYTPEYILLFILLYISQAQLIPLHARGLSAHRAEFVAYRLLHALALRAATLAQELHQLLSSLPPGEADGDGGAAPSVAQARVISCDLA